MKIRSAEIAKHDIDRALTSPTAVFDHPEEVVEHTDLSLTEKIEILKRWELDARALQRATDESMGGGEPPLLDEVNEALLLLDPKDRTADQFGKAPTAI
jgi:hypothetical protein